MRHVAPPAAARPLVDRLPTFHELATFHAGAAWDGFAPEQQRNWHVGAPIRYPRAMRRLLSHNAPRRS